jgi:hypothetical protein
MPEARVIDKCARRWEGDGDFALSDGNTGRHGHKVRKIWRAWASPYPRIRRAKSRYKPLTITRSANIAVDLTVAEAAGKFLWDVVRR